MTIKATDIIGLKIISLQNGKELGQVKDLVYDPDEIKMTALIVEEGGIFSEAKLIPFNEIRNIGDDAVIIESANKIKKISEIDSKISQIAKANTYITNTKVLTNNGIELGTVSDLLLDPTTGIVGQMEISQGMIKDVRSGKKYIDISQIETIGKDIIIVKPEVESIIRQQSQNQGLEGVVNQTVSQGKEFVENPDTQRFVAEKKDELKDGFGEIKSEAQDIGKNIQEKVSEIGGNIRNKQVENSIGKYLSINLLDENDAIIAKRGDLITHKLVNKAESLNLLNQILNNVSDEPINNKR
jgi:uncharacterized protein YrrD